jgi:hypothetical protein
MGNVEGEKEDFRSQHSGNHPINIGTTMIAYGGVMHVLRVLRWFLLNRRIGPVVVCFIRVLKDVVYIFAVFIVIYVAFVLGLWFMYKPFTVAGGGVDPKTKVCSEDSMFCTGDKSIMENAGMREMFSHIFWKVFDGDAKQDAMIQTREEFMKNSTVFSLEFSHFMGYSMWAMYQGLTVILLMTILIAQMNSTYQRVWENVDAEWKYSKCFSQVQFLTPRAILPPPFRWVYYLARLIKYFRERSKSWKTLVKTEEEHFRQMEDYMALLQRLVRTKMHSESEASKIDSFKDLRVDIRNELSELKSTMAGCKIVWETEGQ